MNSNQDAAEEREIFLQAMDLESGQARHEFIQRACAGNPAKLARIEGLLRANAQATEFFDDPPAFPIRQGTDDITEQPGMRIGRYRLLERIGEGGCGVVFMAEQEEPVRRRVALKVIKAGMDSRAIVARFEAERQALAMMDHPNIAKVFDGGTTEQGRPYFVMELVRGTPITQFCERENLGVAQRLQLFVGVCQAVQHAHQKGIIHRDLKPSNVLVAVHDDHPVPKVIDFGIAKAIEGALTERIHFTAHNQLVGTPAYMSPEQAGLSDLDVDTRSDIYTLGVLLYELLTGVTPLDAKALLATGLDAMCRAIREQEPVRPSTRLLELRKASTLGTEKAELEAGALAVDLDWIVMKCLEKQRSRRYETASSLAADLQRHLANEPVIARPPSLQYRLVKAIRRNRLAFAAGALVAVSLLVGLTLAGWMYLKQRQALAQEQAALKEVRQEKDRADAAARDSEKAWARATEEKRQAESNFVKVREADGWRRANEGDFFGAMAAFADVLRLEAHDPARSALHRQRLASILRNCPRLNNVWSAGPGLTWAAFSKDGQKLLTANSLSPTQAIAQIRDASTGQALTPPMPHAAPIASVYWNADETRLVTASLDRTARVWDARTGKPLTPPLVHEGPVTFASMDTQGERVVTRSEDPSSQLFATLWSVESARRVWTNQLELDPSFGPLFFVANDTEVLALTTRFETSTGKVVGSVPLRSTTLAMGVVGDSGDWTSTFFMNQPPKADLGIIARDPRSELIFLHNPEVFPKGSILTDTTNSFDIIRQWKGMSVPERAVFSDIGGLAVAGPEGILVMGHISRDWDPTLVKIKSKVSAMAFSTNWPFLAVGHSDGAVLVFDMGEEMFNPSFENDDKASLKMLYSRLPHSSQILGVSLTDNGTGVRAICEDGSVTEWTSALSRTPQMTFKISKGETVTGITKSGMNLVGRIDCNSAWTKGRLQKFHWPPVWSLETGSRYNWAIVEEESFCDKPVFFTDDTMLERRGGDIFVSTLRDGATHRIKFADDSISTNDAFSFQPCAGSILVSGYKDGRELKSFDPRTGEIRSTITLQTPVRHFLLNESCSRLFLVETNGTASLWDVSSAQRLGTTQREFDDVVPQAFSADGKRLLIDRPASKMVEIWNDQLEKVASAPSEIRWWQFYPQDELGRAGLSPDLEHTWQLKLGKLALGQTMSPSFEHPLDQVGVVSACFSPDSRILAAASVDGQIRFWDTSTGDEAWLPLSTSGSPRILWFTPDGTQLIVEKHDRVEVWDLKSTLRSDEEWARIAGFFSPQSQTEFSPESNSGYRRQSSPVKSKKNQSESGAMAQRWSELQRSLSGPLFENRDDSPSRLHFDPVTLENGGNWDAAFSALGSMVLRDPDNVYLRYRRANAAVRSAVSGKFFQLKTLEIEGRLKQSLEDLDFVTENIRCLESNREVVRRELSRLRALPLALLGKTNEAEHCQAVGLGIPKFMANRDPNWVNLVPWFTGSLALFGNPKREQPVGDYPVFDVRGRIRLASGILDEPADFDPVLYGIPIHRRFKRAHCLVGAGNLTPYHRSGDRTLVGRLIFRYSDDKTSTVELRIGDDVLEHAPEDSGITLPRNSRLAVSWPGSSEDPRYRVRAYHRPWDNPRPDVQVVSVDFVSAMNSVIPYLYAITLEP